MESLLGSCRSSFSTQDYERECTPLTIVSASVKCKNYLSIVVDEFHMNSSLALPTTSAKLRRESALSRRDIRSYPNGGKGKVVSYSSKYS